MTIADILTQKGLLTAEQLADAQRLQLAEGLRLDRAVVQQGWLTEQKLLEVAAGMPSPMKQDIVKAIQARK